MDSSSPSALAGVDLLFSTTGDAVLAVDAETGVLLRANESLETITGMSLASLVGNDVSLLSPAPRCGRSRSTARSSSTPASIRRSGFGTSTDIT